MASEEANRAKLRRAFDAHYKAVSRYCHRRLPADDANDAVAQVFAIAWRKVDEMPTGESTLPWLYGVARYEVSSVRRSTQRRRNLREKLDGQAYHPEAGPEALVVRNLEQRDMIRALHSLRPSDQEVLRLRAYEELSIPEIAVVLGCSVEAAKKRAARAMRRLRRAAGVGTEPIVVSGERPAFDEGGEG